MNNTLSFLSLAPRADAVAAVQKVLPECIQAAAQDVGPEGVKALFAGYKDSVDLHKRAA